MATDVGNHRQHWPNVGLLSGINPTLALGWYYNVGCPTICQPFQVIGWFANVGPMPTLATIGDGLTSDCNLGYTSVSAAIAQITSCGWANVGQV